MSVQSNALGIGQRHGVVSKQEKDQPDASGSELFQSTSTTANGNPEQREQKFTQDITTTTNNLASSESWNDSDIKKYISEIKKLAMSFESGADLSKKGKTYHQIKSLLEQSPGKLEDVECFWDLVDTAEPLTPATESKVLLKQNIVNKLTIGQKYRLLGTKDHIQVIIDGNEVPIDLNITPEMLPANLVDNMVFLVRKSDGQLVVESKQGSYSVTVKSISGSNAEAPSEKTVKFSNTATVVEFTPRRPGSRKDYLHTKDKLEYGSPKSCAFDRRNLGVAKEKFNQYAIELVNQSKSFEDIFSEMCDLLFSISQLSQESFNAVDAVLNAATGLTPEQKDKLVRGFGVVHIQHTRQLAVLINNLMRKHTLKKNNFEYLAIANLLIREMDVEKLDRKADIILKQILSGNGSPVDIKQLEVYFIAQVDDKGSGSAE